MGYLGAIPHHADRFTHENSFQDRARVTRQFGSADDLHFFTSPQKIRSATHKYILFAFSVKRKGCPTTRDEISHQFPVLRFGN
jgi:hypothetical protein